MSAIPATVPNPAARSPQAPDPGPNGFLKYLPVVKTHAEIWFRGVPETDREECISEAIAAAFVNYRSACRRGRSAAIRPSMLARFAVQHVNAYRHVGGSQEGKNDALGRRARQIHGFEVQGLPENEAYDFDILKVPDQDVWRLRLRHDRHTAIPDQVSFRIDWSQFLAKQHDRTRTAIAMLAAGYKQVEVADRLGTTASAVCQRMAKAGREWLAYQGDGDANPPPSASTTAVNYRPFRLREPGQRTTEPRTAA